jgi:hypothetical protein
MADDNKPDGSGNSKPPLSEEDVDKARAWTGLFVVVGGDVAIAVAAIFALVKFAGSAKADTAVIASVLSSAFAAIGTMTTAYFGIRESATTAQRSVKHQNPNP